MHKYIITRGKSVYVNQWKDEMEGKFLAHKLKDANNKDLPPSAVQLVMRPIQLWELVYPEDQEDNVNNLIGEERYQDSIFTKLKNFFCRLVGLEKAELKQSLMMKPIPRKLVAVHVLGNKKDDKDRHGNELL